MCCFKIVPYSCILAWILLFLICPSGERKMQMSMIQSFCHPIIEWLQTHKDKKGKAVKKSDVVLVIFFDWCFYYSNCTSPDNKNTFTLLSVNNILQINLKTIFETSMGFKPRSSTLALQCSANRAAKTHTLGAGQIVEYILTCERNEAWNEVRHFNLYFCVPRHLKFKS